MEQVKEMNLATYSPRGRIINEHLQYNLEKLKKLWVAKCLIVQTPKEKDKARGDGFTVDFEGFIMERLESKCRYNWDQNGEYMYDTWKIEEAKIVKNKEMAEADNVNFMGILFTSYKEIEDTDPADMKAYCFMISDNNGKYLIPQDVRLEDEQISINNPETEPTFMVHLPMYKGEKLW